MHKIIVVVAAWLRPWLHRLRHLENLFSDAMRSRGECHVSCKFLHYRYHVTWSREDNGRTRGTPQNMLPPALNLRWREQKYQAYKITIFVSDLIGKFDSISFTFTCLQMPSIIFHNSFSILISGWKKSHLFYRFSSPQIANTLPILSTLWLFFGFVFHNFFF